MDNFSTQCASPVFEDYSRCAPVNVEVRAYRAILRGGWLASPLNCLIASNVEPSSIAEDVATLEAVRRELKEGIGGDIQRRTNW